MSCKEPTESNRAHVALQEIRKNCRRHIMLQIYGMARPYFRRYLEGTWRESDLEVPGQLVLCSIGEIAWVMEEMAVNLEEWGKEALEEWWRKSKVETEKKAAGEASDKSPDGYPNKTIDHSRCVPRERLFKLSQDLLVGGSVLTRSHAESLVEQEMKRTEAQAPECSVEELLNEFGWPEGVTHEKELLQKS